MSCFVMKEMCKTCIFHPDNRMHLRKGRLKEMTDETDRNDSNVICHQSKDLIGNLEVQAWCKGSVERRPGKVVRFGEWVGAIKEVEVPQ